MKIIDNIPQNSPEWLELRKGKITGSKLSDIVTLRGSGRKIGFYQLIADKLSLDDESEDGTERGHALEREGIEALSSKIGIDFEQVGLCCHDEYPDIANSPDGLAKIEGKYSVAAEVKCLSGARHIEAWHTKELDNSYRFQALQYFIVNPDLETLYFAFYDPRIASIPIHYLTLKREDFAEDIQKYFEYQVETLAVIDELVEQLSF